ncbi:putative bax protein [Reinekea sp. MED297]|uniref:Putative bax protein n=1 Tax=Reinekea blandensis MED297 TaxID=314283 RepID=A4BC65_9GAMM|nr:putative bax protein [Reinekea sp. MED297] [Reinekea blandensis MED297]
MLATAWCFFFCLSDVFANESTSVETNETSVSQDAELPEMAAISDVQTKKDTFFGFLEPIIEQANLRIQAERAWLKVIETDLRNDRALAAWQHSLLEKLGNDYKVDEPVGSRAYFAELFLRVDVLPASLVLAQAANESAWGTSRFAVDGNNLFGQWCFTKGCGLVPSGRDSDESHEVRVFDSVTESVNSYFRNINTHRQYHSLRTIRSELRYLGQALDSETLAWGLEGYSIRGEHYIRELIAMIRYNRLDEFDQPAFYASRAIEVRRQ